MCDGPAAYDVCGVCDGTNDCCSDIAIDNDCTACSGPSTCTAAACDAPDYVATASGDACELRCPVATDETIQGLVDACLAEDATGDCGDAPHHGCPMNDWDVSGVTDMSYLFFHAPTAEDADEEGVRVLNPLASTKTSARGTPLP